MTFDPYRVLKVGRAATKEQITKAYRKLVMKYHPDRHGDPEKFKAVQRAYDILGDYERRAKYDLTGDVGEVKDNGFVESLNYLVNLVCQNVMAMAEKGINPKTNDVMQFIRGGLEQSIVKIKEHVQKNKDALVVLKEIRDRFIIDDGENAMKMAVTINLDMANKGMNKNEEELAKMVKCLELIKKYKYRCDGVSSRKESTAQFMTWLPFPSSFTRP